MAARRLRIPLGVFVLGWAGAMIFGYLSGATDTIVVFALWPIVALLGGHLAVASMILAWCPSASPVWERGTWWKLIAAAISLGLLVFALGLVAHSRLEHVAWGEAMLLSIPDFACRALESALDRKPR